MEKDLGNEQTKYHETGARLRQSSELRRVEATYEGLLLKETVFPNADETNLEVLNWADRVMSNWSVFCGSDWQDKDLGGGGKEAMSRGVLEVSVLWYRVSQTELPVYARNH